MAIVSSLAEDLWVSKDAGATFAHYKTPNPVDDVKWHNKKEDWVLARMCTCLFLFVLIDSGMCQYA